MNFDFSDEQKQLRDQVRRFLGEHCTTKHVRAVLEGKHKYDRNVWRGLADLGLLGIAIPEEYGGTGAGHLELCVVAEELGRALAPIPYSSTIYLAAELLLRVGTEAQKKQFLPKIAAGEVIGTVALVESMGDPTPASIRTIVQAGRITGHKTLVPEGEIADFAIIVGRENSLNDEAGIGLYLVDLKSDGVHIKPVETVDPTRNHAEVTFTNVPVEALGNIGEGWMYLNAALDRAAVLVAFEQIGGADRALEIGRDYALDRMAFGRQIGSFQAIKHILADMYVATTLARSNAYYGAWAFSTNAAELGEAAANVRISATQAYQLCSKNSIHVHGGMGFTWEYDCHLFYRRSNLLALSLGSLTMWENRLIDAMCKTHAAA